MSLRWFSKMQFNMVNHVLSELLIYYISKLHFVLCVFWIRCIFLVLYNSFSLFVIHNQYTNVQYILDLCSLNVVLCGDNNTVWKSYNIFFFQMNKLAKSFGLCQIVGMVKTKKWQRATGNGKNTTFVTKKKYLVDCIQMISF